MQIVNIPTPEDPRLVELRQQLSQIDFPETDEGDFAPFARACREGGKAYHGMIIAEGLPHLLYQIKETLVRNIYDQLNELTNG